MTTKNKTTKEQKDSVLVNALQTDDAKTTNGMVTNSTSLSACVDLFFQIGALRQRSESEKIKVFEKAFGENAIVALKILFYSRDVIAGQGERATFRTILKHLATKYPTIVSKNAHLIPQLGRWDDLYSLFGTDCEQRALELFNLALLLF